MRKRKLLAGAFIEDKRPRQTVGKVQLEKVGCVSKADRLFGAILARTQSRHMNHSSQAAGAPVNRQDCTKNYQKAGATALTGTSRLSSVPAQPMVSPLVIPAQAGT
jgi:hypothetical protein